MLCTVIKGPDFAHAQAQLTAAIETSDLVELRLDHFHDCEQLDLNALKALQLNFNIPMIFTLRPLSQGGRYKGTENERLEQLAGLAALNPAFIDLEWQINLEFIATIKVKHPAIKIILSYHNFETTPQDLPAILSQMQTSSVHYYKIACMASSSLDALKILKFVQDSKKNAKVEIIGISMGEKGQISRILAPLFGNSWSYVAADKNSATAPGQLTAAELLQVYNYQLLNAKTVLCALIGESVEKSISHITHNAVMKACGLNAVYIKISLQASELELFFELAQELGFWGLSVTMPYKETVLVYLDRLEKSAQAIGAVNTIVFEKNAEKSLVGYNTDGNGALKAIQEVLNGDFLGKKVVVIGAGGAAKAIAYAAHQKGCLVTILNRNKQKAQEYALYLGCFGEGLEHIGKEASKGYDIVINGTPLKMPFDRQHIVSNAIVMDIKSRPKNSDFLRAARKKGCQVVYGYQMFVHQAIAQFEIWFGKNFDAQKAINVWRDNF